MKKLVFTIFFLSTSLLLAQPTFTPYSDGNPVISKGTGFEWDRSSLWWPNVSFIQDTFYLTYIGTNDFPNSSLSIGLATSTDGYNFTKHPTPILQANGSDIESYSVGSGPLYKKDSIWYLYYNGISTDPSDPGRVIARANSSSPYGPWERENDTLLTVGNNGEWDDAFVLPLSIVKNNDELVLYYFGGDVWPNPTGQIGMAVSSDDGATWEKYSGNPILSPGPSSYDAVSIWGASIIKSNSIWEMFYAGKKENTNINVLCYATSEDGILWTKHGIILTTEQDQLANNILEGPSIVKTESEYFLYYDYGLPSNGIGLATSKRSSTLLEVPFEFSTIQAGIDAASTGDTVLVAEGTYLENINFKGKAITVASHFILDQDTSHISKTIIDGSQPSDPDSGSVIYFISGEDTTSVLSGFTITGGTGTLDPFPIRYGGGIACGSSGAKIINNIIENNSLVSDLRCDGSGISAGPPYTNSIVVIRDNIIRNNYAEGGNHTSGGVSVAISAIIENNRVQKNNTVSSIGNCSSGILCNYYGGINKKLLVANNVVTHNKANSSANHIDGGLNAGIGAAGGAYGLITNNTIKYNEVSAKNVCYGPGVFIEECDSNLIIEGNQIAYNTFTEGECKGGGISLYKSHSAVIGNNIYNNSATYGGGIYQEESNSKIIGNRIANNTAEISGGGIECRTSSNPQIMNNIIAYNGSAINAGGISFYQAQGLVINSTIVKNSSIIAGGGISVDGYADPIIINTILFDNKANSIGNEVFVGDDNSDPSFVFCNIQGGADEFGYFDVNSTYSGIYENNINLAPLFADDSLFNLSEGSPCVGNGIASIEINGTTYNCPLTDYFGNQRPHDGDNLVDIGAIESPHPWVDPTGVSLILSEVPKQFNLSQNYPNPFNPSTTIKYSIPSKVKSEKSNVASDFSLRKITLKVYDILGREVTTLVSEKQKPGFYEAQWNAGNQPSGIYFYKLTTGDYIETKKMILLR